MNINHNRIKVADLEQNQPNKTLTTDQNGELEFTDINNIKTENYNALDYLNEGKALDARQGKVLKDLIDNINTLLESDNVNLDTVQKLVDAIEIMQNSLNSILLNAPSIEKVTIVDEDRIVVDDSENFFYKKSIRWSSIKTTLASFFMKTFKTIIPNASINYTFKLSDAYNGLIIHSSSSAITEIIPNNSLVPFPIGTVLESVATGTGIRTTTAAAGVILQTNLSLDSMPNEVRKFKKIESNTWLIEGNHKKGVLKTENNTFSEQQNFDKEIKIGKHDLGFGYNELQDGLIISKAGNGSTPNTNPKIYQYKGLNRLSNEWSIYHDFMINDQVIARMYGKYQTPYSKYLQVFGEFTSDGLATHNSGSKTTQMEAKSILLQGSTTYGKTEVLRTSTGNQIITEVLSSTRSSGSWCNRIQFSLITNSLIKIVGFYIEEIDTTLVANTSTKIKMVVNGSFKTESLDLSSLGIYANDASAATGGVPIGFGYISSLTGSVQRRLI